MAALGAAAVNYKDIMLATGKLQREADANNGALGFEWSGRVRTVCLMATVRAHLLHAPHLLEHYLQGLLAWFARLHNTRGVLFGHDVNPAP